MGMFGLILHTPCPEIRLHVAYSVRLSSLHSFYKIRIIFQLSSADSTHQAQQINHFRPFSE